MPLTDPIQGWTTPAGSELPDGAAAFADLADHAVRQVNLRFANPTARDAAIAVGARKAGMRAWIDSLGYFQMVTADGGSWVQEYYRDVFAGTEAAIDGTNPTAGVHIVKKRVMPVVATNASGGFSFSWPGAFANGITWFQVTPGDNAANLGIVAPQYGFVTKSVFAGVAYSQAGALLASTTIRLSAQAEGW